MKIQIETNNHVGSQILNVLKKFGVEFTVERDGSLEYVDLGLPSGLKWAKCNVGAKTPTECGKYFRWGEVVDAREMGSMETYDYNKPFEDTATHHMGKAWRMPTKEDLEELCNNTTSKWVKDYQGSGVNGKLFISKINGNELFFPAAGFYDSGLVFNPNQSGYIWSSSFDAASCMARNLGLYDSYDYLCGFNPCYYCFSVRGIRN